MKNEEEKKNITLKSQDIAADEIASNEDDKVSKQGKKSFGRKV